MEKLNHVKLFTRTDELDGLACHIAYRKCGTAARVTVHFCEDNARNVQKLIKSLCDVDSLLTCHGIDCQKDLCGFYLRLDVGKLLHQNLIDLESTRGIDKYKVVAIFFGLGNALLGDLYGRNLVPERKHGNPHRFTYHL